jgi:hypothetical protein
LPIGFITIITVITVTTAIIIIIAPTITEIGLVDGRITHRLGTPIAPMARMRGIGTGIDIMMINLGSNYSLEMSH